MVQNQKEFFLLPSGQQSSALWSHSIHCRPLLHQLSYQKFCFLCLRVYTYVGPLICMCL